MTVIIRIAQRSIGRRFLQSLLFVIGVALGVAMIIAIDLANGSASRAFNLSSESLTGRATHQITGGPSGIPSELYTQLRRDLALREIAPVLTSYVRALELGQQPLRLLGIDAFAEPPFRDYLNEIEVAGASLNAFEALNRFIAEPNTVLISQSLAERFGVAAGETITLQPGDQRVTVTVLGLLRAADRASAEALDDLLLADIATAQEILGLPGRISHIDLILPDDYDTAQIEALLPPGVLLQSSQEANGTLAQLTAAFELNLQALSLLALTVGVFLIYNTVTFSVVQRRPVIGTMRALGATRRQIFALILSEALLLGLTGTILGLGLGLIFGRGAVNLVSRTISDLYFTVNVQSITVAPAILLKGALIGLAASLLAALPPSLEATRTPPAGTLRRSDVEQRTLRLLPLMTLAGLVLNAFGFLLLQIPSDAITLGFIALFAFVLGGALFTPLVLVLLMRLLTPLSTRIFGILGRMAPRAVIRSLSRTSIAVAALTVAVSVIVGVSVMIGSFRGTVADWLDNTLGADIYVSPPTITATRVTVDVDAAVLDRLEQVEGVTRVVAARHVDVVAPDYPDLPPVNLNSGSGEIAAGERRFAWLSVSDYWAALDSGQVLVSEPFAFRRGITPENNTIRLVTDRGVESFTIAGVYYDYSTDQGSVFMALDVYRQFYDDPFISSAALFVAEDADIGEVIDLLETEVLAGTDLGAQSNRALRNGAFEVFERAFAITGALQLLATVVAFIGILSALMALQLEHTREYGLMRATGMTPRQLWRYTLIQTGMMGITAGLLALPVGLLLALVLTYVINLRSFGWTLALDLQPGPFVQAFTVAVVAALLAGLYPAWRLTQLVTARALRSE